MSPLDGRRSLLARLHARAQLATTVGAHPMPVADPPRPTVSTTVQPDDLVGSFETAATAVGARVTRVATSAQLAEVARDIRRRHSIRVAVASKQRAAWPAVEALGALRIEVNPFDVQHSAAADLGLTVATAAVASTGSVAQSSEDVGGRSVSLLPRVHWCLVPASCIVASTSEVFLPARDRGLPSNLVLVTGPSKSADIEQIIVTGVHGPVALELTVILDI